MDLKSTGKFIAERRKEVNLTQSKLAEKLNISEKTVSKWECGKGFPDTSLILPLCDELGITSNELLSARLLSNEEYKNTADKNIVALKGTNEHLSKLLLISEWFIGIFSVLIILAGAIVASYLDIAEIWRVLIVVGSLLLAIPPIVFAIWIEKDAGFYECGHCHHKYIPTWKAVIWSMHMGRTRKMKCPKCGKKTWNKKILSGE